MLIKKPDTNGLMTTIVLNTKISEVEKKVPDSSSLVTTTVLNTKVSEAANTIPDHSKYITNSEFNKLTTENFTARVKQANSVNKTDFDIKLISFNRKITSNKAKYLEVLEKVDSLITKDHNFFLGEIYFTSDERSQNTFINQQLIL